MSILRFFYAALTLAILAGATPAQAGLIGGGGNTVNALFFLGDRTLADQETELYLVGATPTVGPAPITATGANFLQGLLDGATIQITDTQIIITNQLALPFCTTSLPCADAFTGFEFQFSSGVDITGASVNAASAADFLPVGLSGIDLLSSTDLLVNVTGDSPAVGSSLTIDLKFPGSTTGPGTVPEPGSMTLLLSGLAGLGIMSRRKRQKS